MPVRNDDVDNMDEIWPYETGNDSIKPETFQPIVVLTCAWLLFYFRKLKYRL